MEKPGQRRENAKKPGAPLPCFCPAIAMEQQKADSNLDRPVNGVCVLSKKDKSCRGRNHASKQAGSEIAGQSGAEQGITKDGGRNATKPERRARHDSEIPGHRRKQGEN